MEHEYIAVSVMNLVVLSLLVCPCLAGLLSWFCLSASEIVLPVMTQWKYHHTILASQTTLSHNDLQEMNFDTEEAGSEINFRWLLAPTVYAHITESHCGRLFSCCRVTFLTLDKISWQSHLRKKKVFFFLLLCFVLFC